MEIRQLRYFARIVELGSVSRASQSLHVAQPALSQQMARLEEELGTKLLLRSARGVVPTEAGLATYRHACLLLKQVDATRLVAQGADRGPSGHVAVGLPWTISTLFGLDLLSAVMQAYPAIRLELVEGPSAALGVSLAEGRLDLAVVFDEAVDAGLSLTPVAEEPLYVVGAAGTLLGQADFDSDATAALPLLLMSRPNSVRELIEDAWAAANVRPNVRAEINAPGVLLGAIQAGLGYSVLPASGIEHAFRSGIVDSALLNGGRLCRTVYLGRSCLHAIPLAADVVARQLVTQMREKIAGGAWQARPVAPGGAR